MSVLQDLTQEKNSMCLQLILCVTTPYFNHFHLLGTCILKMRLAQLGSVYLLSGFVLSEVFAFGMTHRIFRAGISVNTLNVLYINLLP